MIFLSCNSNKEIEGTWISAYTFTKESSHSVGFPFRQVVDFKNKNIRVRDFKYDYLSDINFKKGIYNFRLNKLTYTIDGETLKIDVINKKDSLIFDGITGTNNLYKKIDNNLKSNITESFSKKSFLYRTQKYSDTIHFINDSILRYSNDKEKKNLKWERFKLNDFDILFIEYDIPYVISKSKNNNLLMTGFHQKKYEIELIEIK